MSKLILNDDDIVMTFLSLQMLKGDASDYAPALTKIINITIAKIEGYLRENPMAMESLVKIINSEPELKDHARADTLLELLGHVVGAAKIMYKLKGENEECNLCEGAGRFTSGSGMPCPRCGGSGKLNKKETYN